MSLEAELLLFIATEVAPGAGSVESDTDLLLTGLVDSLGVMRIVDWLERTQEIDIHPADVILDNFQTAGAMVDYVGRRAGSASG